METPEKSFAEALHEEHVALFREIGHLDQAVRPGSGDGPRELTDFLGKVRAHLLHHFEFEEQGGYMAPVIKEEPRLAQVVHELLDEHRQLAQSLDGLIEEVGTARNINETIRDRVREWVRQISHHESRENSLVQEAFYSSGATGD